MEKNSYKLPPSVGEKKLRAAGPQEGILLCEKREKIPIECISGDAGDIVPYRLD